MSRQYMDFPPGWGHIKVPMSTKAAARAALALYSPCAPRGLWAQRVATTGIALFGPRVLPGRSFPWIPMDESEWAPLAAEWRRELGVFDDVAGYSRLQANRTGVAILLLRRGSPIAFVKLRRGDSGSLTNERLAMEAVRRYRPRAFQAPEPLRTGFAGGWYYLASTPLPPGLHRPPHAPPLSAVLAEVDAALGAFPRPPETPGHWRPMHGDFAPWNLRQLGDRSLALIDWEDAGWGPPGADHVFYEATSAALWHRHSGPCEAQEAVEFWRRRVQPQPANARDRRLATSLREALGNMMAPQSD